MKWQSNRAASVSERVPAQCRITAGWSWPCGSTPRRIPVWALTLAALLLCAVTLASGADTITVGVFSLFKPQELRIRAIAGGAVRVHAGGRTIVLEGPASARLRLAGGAIECYADGQATAAGEIRAEAAAPQGGLLLSVPRKIERRFAGQLTVRPGASALIAVVRMSVETAVASAAAAEALPKTPREALKAQAVASRSFYRAHPRGRHSAFDFCDTTHCQFLRAPPEPGHPAFTAASATRGMVLAYEGEPIEALFSARCGGRTRSLGDLHMTAARYPYFAVDCEWCARHPAAWERKLDKASAARLKRRRSERARIELSRVLGWQAIPGSDYDIVENDGQWFAKGRGDGHGAGLCQRGAAGMAIAGASFIQILAHYYPSTTLISLDK